MVTPRPTRILIVDTSTASSGRLNADLAGHGHLQIVGYATVNDVLDQLDRHRPDVVAFDLRSPVENGCTAIRRIMTTHPLPIVVVGGCDADSGAHFAAIEAGALAVTERPVDIAGTRRDEQIAELVQTLQLMAEVRVVRRRPRPSIFSKAPVIPVFEEAVVDRSRIRLVAIGASTGGPAVLQTIFSALPPGFPLPIVVVQHIGSGFLEGMLHWLQESSPLQLHVARSDEPLEPGHVYFASDRQMAVNGGRIVLGSDQPEDGHCPSISYLFRSVARSFGAGAVGVLLTGMGKDGADGLWQMRQHGAITIAQDRDSCVVYGMPGCAEALDAVMQFLPPEKIAPALLAFAAQKMSPAQLHPLAGEFAQDLKKK